MQSIILGLFVALALIAAAVIGSGNVKTEQRAVSDFSGVSLKCSGDVVIEQNGSEKLTITADDNILPYLTAKVKNSQLVLDVKDNTPLQPTSGPDFEISAKKISQIDLSGSGDIAASKLAGDRLKTSISGSGDVTVSGKVDHADIVVAGAGDYQGDALQVKTATVVISGSGDVVLRVSDKLDVKISGSGSVEYIGNPVVTQKISGAGSVEKR